MGSTSEEEEWRALLAHELGHLLRRDTAWLILGRVIVAVFPWHALNRLALRRWQRAAEVECDACAISLGISPVKLASVLTKVAEWKSKSLLAVGIPATASPLTQRIEFLLTDTATDRRRQRAGFVAACLFATMTISWAGPRVVAGDKKVRVTGHSPIAPKQIDTDEAEGKELQHVTEDFAAVEADLSLALKLLEQQSSDAATDDCVKAIIDRLQTIKKSLKHLKYSHD